MTTDHMEEILEHPYVKSLLSSGRFDMSRPYDELPEQYKTGLVPGTLIGVGLISESPLAFSLKEELVEESKENELILVYRLGDKLCGHKGIIHGGLLATILDESLCRCGFAVLPNKVCVTASLNTQYLAPTFADSYLVLKAKTTKVDGRKVWVEGTTHMLPSAEKYNAETDLPATVKAELLGIEPKWVNKLTPRGKAGVPIENGTTVSA